MPYEYLPEMATADIAFRATAPTLEGCFKESTEALLNTMINNPEDVENRQEKTFDLQAPDLDLLLFDLLQECIYLKDVNRLLLHCSKVEIHEKDGKWHARAVVTGEPLDPKRHHQRVDVKAVTLHSFSLQETPSGWAAQMILDI
jgi:SHS2 domain-containing protein